jgi:hypothetical protein
MVSRRQTTRNKASVRDRIPQYITTNGQLYTVSADIEEDCVWRIMVVEKGEGKTRRQGGYVQVQEGVPTPCKRRVGNRDGMLQAILFTSHESFPSQFPSK